MLHKVETMDASYAGVQISKKDIQSLLSNLPIYGNIHSPSISLKSKKVWHYLSSSTTKFLFRNNIQIDENQKGGRGTVTREFKYIADQKQKDSDPSPDKICKSLQGMLCKECSSLFQCSCHPSPIKVKNIKAIKSNQQKSNFRKEPWAYILKK